MSLYTQAEYRLVKPWTHLKTDNKSKDICRIDLNDLLSVFTALAPCFRNRMSGVHGGIIIGIEYGTPVK